MATKPRVGADDLWRMPEDDIRRELVNGEVIEMPPVGPLHGKFSGRVYKWIADYIALHPAGEVLVGDVGFVLNLPEDPERVRAPDVAYISTERLPEGGVTEKFIHNAPDLAVEILSPSDTSDCVVQKVQEYMQSNARLVWVVAPKTKTVTVYRADGSAQLLQREDILDGEDVLPGLKIPLSELFRR